MAGRKHLVAMNRAIRAAGLDEAGVDAATVELARDLARQMDNPGEAGPSMNLMKMYLSVTKDIARAAARKPAPNPREEAPEVPVTEGAPALTLVEESPLDKLRRKKQRTA